MNRKFDDDQIGIGRLDVLGYEIPPDKPVILKIGGKLTRSGAMYEARKLHGDMAMISDVATDACLVWEIGYFNQTVGRGTTWELAIARSRVRSKEKK